MKILLIENNKEVSDFVMMILESLEHEVTQCFSINEALEVIEGHQDFNIIFCEYEIASEPGYSIYKQLLDKALPIAFALFTQKKLSDCHEFENFLLESHFNSYISKPYRDDVILDFIEKIEENLELLTPPQKRTGAKSSPRIHSDDFKVANEIDNLVDNTDFRQEQDEANVERSEFIEKVKLPLPTQDYNDRSESEKESFQSKSYSNQQNLQSQSTQNITENFRAIKINRFYGFENAPCDIYILIGSKKFIKILHKNTSISTSIIEKYLAKSTHFYVKAQEWENISKLFLARLNLKLKRSQSNIMNKSAVSFIIMDVLNEEIRQVGIGQSTIDKAKFMLESSKLIIEGHKELGALFDQIARGNNYASEHSVLLTCICLELCDEIKWNQDQILRKLSLAAIFHDIALLENKELMELTSIDSPHLSIEEKELVKNHPLEAVKKLEMLQDLPQGIDKIVLEHHERADGKGFPKCLKGVNVSPLSAVFIIAHEYAHYLFEKKKGKESESKDELLARLQNSYNSGNFKTPYQAFMKRLSKTMI